MMSATPRQEWRTPILPDAIPGIISFWDFQDEGKRLAKGKYAYELKEMVGSIERKKVDGAPFGAYAAHLQEGQWFKATRDKVPKLNRSGKNSALTVLAWIKREKCAKPSCEFIAGQWNETHLGRQYGLFINIGTWGGKDQVCGHLSQHGGPTFGYKYCMDGAIGKTEVPWDEWHVVGMSYDGTQGMVWYDGLLDRQESLNPYHYAGGLHDGGKKGSDFTVGAVHRSGEMGNFFAGYLGGLAVYERALSPAEIFGLSAKRV